MSLLQLIERNNVAVAFSLNKCLLFAQARAMEDKMEMKLIKSSHAVGESNFHIQLTPAYRQDIFRDEQVTELTLAFVLEKLSEFKVVILGYGFGPEHLHLFIANVRFVGEVELVRQIKGYSSYKMRKHFSNLFRDKLWGKKFWSEGHF